MSNLFLRHGEVENKKNIHYSNLPGFNLSKTGKEQALKVGKNLNEYFKISKIISSPLLRARETSKIINSFLKVEIEYSKNILEWEGPYGWTGKTLSEIKLTKEFQIYKNFPENKDYTSESLNSVFQRVLEKYERESNVLFVSHQDTIRSFFYHFLNQSDFNQNKPEHCEIQYVSSDNKLERIL